MTPPAFIYLWEAGGLRGATLFVGRRPRRRGFDVADAVLVESTARVARTRPECVRAAFQRAARLGHPEPTLILPETTS